LRRQFIADQRDDFLESRKPRRRVELQNEGVRVAVEHQPGPAITFAMDPAMAIGGLVEQPGPPAERVAQPLPPPRGVDRDGFAGVQHTNPQWGVGVEEPQGEKAIPPVVNDREFPRTGRPILFANAVAEDPRVAAAHGLFRGGGDAEAEAGRGGHRAVVRRRHTQARRVFRRRKAPSSRGHRGSLTSSIFLFAPPFPAKVKPQSLGMIHD
jgi:hypothetical protein